MFFGGSDLAVSAKSAKQGLAGEWIKILTNLETQTQLAKEGGVIPNQEGAFVGHEGNEFLMRGRQGSPRSREFTPVTPCWGNVESSGVLQDMLVKIFTGSSVDEPTTEATAAITTRSTAADAGLLRHVSRWPGFPGSRAIGLPGPPARQPRTNRTSLSGGASVRQAT